MGGGERGKKTCTSSNPGWYQFFKEVKHGWISKPSLQNHTWAYACAGSQETHFEGLLEVAELKTKRSCWKFSDLQQLPTMDNTGGQEVLAWRLVRRWRRPYIQPGGRYSTWLMKTWNHPPGGVLEAGEDERSPGWPAMKPSSPYPFLLDQYWWLLVCKKFGLDDILVFSALDVLAQQINSLLIAVGVQMILWNGSELTRLSFLLYWSTDTSRHSLVAVSCLHQRIHVISAIIWFGVYSFCIKNQHGHLQLFLL